MSKFTTTNNTLVFGVSSLNVSKKIAFNKYLKYCAPIVAVIPLLHSVPSYAQTPPITETTFCKALSTKEETPEERARYPKVKVDCEALLGMGTTTIIPAADRFNHQFIDSRLRATTEIKFTPKEKLKIRIEIENSPLQNSSLSGTNMTRLGYDGLKAIAFSWIRYEVPIGNSTQLIIEPVGSSYSDNMERFSSKIQSSPSKDPDFDLGNASNGSMSRFGRYTPIYRLSKDGAGVSIKHEFSNEWSASASYTIPSLIPINSSDPFAPFHGANSGAIQVKYQPSDEFKIGATIAQSYHPNGIGVSGSTGSLAANNPFNGASTTAQHATVNSSYKIDRNTTVSAWAGITNAQAEDGRTSQSTNYALTLAVNNVFGVEGNALGVVIGVPPKSNQDRDTSLHLEGTYKIKVDKNMDITPGLLVITNPEHNGNNAPIVMMTVRAVWRL
jgi:hypothetical protein